MTMLHRTLPGTDLNLSMLGFGNFVFGTNWWGDFDDNEAVRLQDYAVAQGVTFFDTGAAYGNGRAERLLARTIKQAGRDRLTVSTKFGYDFYDDPGEEGGHRERRQDFSPKFLRYDLEQSLARLEIDSIDLYQAHNLKLPDLTDGLCETMERFRDEGKIRHWGVSLGPAIGWREEGRAAFVEYDAAVVQTVFNLYEQDPGRALCHICHQRERGGVLARVPTHSGILDEEFTSTDHVFPERDHRKFRDRNWLVYGLRKNEVIRPLAEAEGSTLRQFAFRWLMSQEAVSSIEPNILSTQDIDDFCAAAEQGPLAAVTLEQLDTLYVGDFNLGDEAHPCDLKSSVAEGGVVRSRVEDAL